MRIRPIATSKFFFRSVCDRRIMQTIIQKVIHPMTFQETLQLHL